MISIFYNKNGLNDICIIKILSNNKKDITKTNTIINKESIINFVDGEIESVAISNVSKKIQLPEGYLKWNQKIANFVKSETGYDLNKFNEKNFIVGKIKKSSLIPNTHLNLCEVLINNNDCLQIVCGAKNTAINSLVVISMVNNIMPNGLIIKKSKLQSHDSCGMLCSKKELFNLEEESEGIIHLEEKEIGTEYLEHYANYKDL